MNQKKLKQVIYFFSLMMLLVMWCGDVVAVETCSGVDTAVKKKYMETLANGYRKGLDRNGKLYYLDANGKKIAEDVYENAQKTETKTGAQRDRQQTEDDDDEREDRRNPIIVGGVGNTLDPAVAQIMGWIAGLKAIEKQKKRLQKDYDKCADADAKKALGSQIEGLSNQYGRLVERIGQLDSPYGRAVFAGLAGNDAKALQNLPIQSVPEGIALGLFVKFSGACSKVLEPRIESAADNVVGGSWDFCATRLGNAWNSVFHDGKKGFSDRNLAGWQTLIKICFEDIERLQRDGLKDYGRGQDMTLRDPDETAEEVVKINAWQFLVDGYGRQFDFIVTQIDKHLTYYSEEEDDVMVYYAQEIKRRLLEVKYFLESCKSIKDLDVTLDSNKAIIPALRKNIDNLFARLIDLIKSQVSQTKVSTTYTPSRTTYGTQRDTLTGAGDDTEYPHSFRGGY